LELGHIFFELDASFSASKACLFEKRCDEIHKNQGQYLFNPIFYSA